MDEEQKQQQEQERLTRIAHWHCFFESRSLGLFGGIFLFVGIRLLRLRLLRLRLLWHL